MPVVHDDDEADDVHVPSQHDEHSIKNRNVPSSAVLPVIRPALGRQQSVSDSAKVAMQEYLNHFLGNLDIVNSREVTKALFWTCSTNHHEKFKYHHIIVPESVGRHHPVAHFLLGHNICENAGLQISGSFIVIISARVWA